MESVLVEDTLLVMQVGWDESTAGERQRRVSLWEIELLTTFLVYPPTANWRLRHPWPESLGASFSSGILLKCLCILLG